MTGEGKQGSRGIAAVGIGGQLREIDASLLMQLEATAREAARHAYAPYSNFPVGAAILTASGKIHSGCNVENASYGLTNCAERTAIFKAISEGQRGLKAVVIYTPTAMPTPPCGACRQVVSEFGPDCVVVSICNSTEKTLSTARELLPGAFTPSCLEETSKS